jgi:hypothetical protein
LFALLNGDSGESNQRRRRLQEAPDPLTIEWCTEQALAGNITQGCRDFSNAEKNAADEADRLAAEAAKAAQEEAERSRKEAAAAEEGVTAAWTTKVETGGTSVEDLINQKEKDYQMLKIKAKSLKNGDPEKYKEV